MHLGIAGSSRGLGTAGNANHFRHIWDQGAQVLIVERPWTLVGRLVLYEANLGGIRVSLKCLAQACLLYTSDAADDCSIV